MSATSSLPAPPATCLAKLYSALSIDRNVAPEATFPRPGGVLAHRLAATPAARGVLPCADCTSPCTLRRFMLDDPTR
jgi:hypothetical protein